MSTTSAALKSITPDAPLNGRQISALVRSDNKSNALDCTALEMFGTIIYAVGRLVLPLSLIYTFIYSMAIAVYHYRHGWF